MFTQRRSGGIKWNSSKSGPFVTGRTPQETKKKSPKRDKVIINDITLIWSKWHCFSMRYRPRNKIHLNTVVLWVNNSPKVLFEFFKFQFILLCLLIIHHYHSHLMFIFSHLVWDWTGDNCPPHQSIQHHMFLRSHQAHYPPSHNHSIFSWAFLLAVAPRSHLPHLTQCTPSALVTCPNNLSFLCCSNLIPTYLNYVLV